VWRTTFIDFRSCDDVRGHTNTPRTTAFLGRRRAKTAWEGHPTKAHRRLLPAFGKPQNATEAFPTDVWIPRIVQGRLDVAAGGGKQIERRRHLLARDAQSGTKTDRGLAAAQEQ